MARRRRKLKKSFITAASVIFAVILTVIIVSVSKKTSNEVSVSSVPGSSNSVSGEYFESEVSPTESNVSEDADDTEDSSASSAASASATESKAKVSSPPASAPLGGNYIDVGTAYVCEVVTYEDETFDASGNNDNSKPTNNVLPVGTVDYCSSSVIKHPEDDKTYLKLRCGKRVYKESLGTTRAEMTPTSTYGYLPSTNNVSIRKGGLSSGSRYTELVLDVDWKAPFTLDVYPQSYVSTNDDSRNYTISAATYNYVDITFCYGSKTSTADISNIDFSGTIFKSAEWKKNTSDYTLRLYLRKTGAFYGWYAEYNSSGDLVFRFLNPHKITVSGSSVNLKSAKIYIDVGHGGNDSGAVGKIGGTTYYEADMNLALAKLVKFELETCGASVTMSRTDNGVKYQSVVAQQKAKDAKPDFIIAIHHDSSKENRSIRGMGTYHFNPFSYQAAKCIRTSVASSGVYSTVADVKWHYYFNAKVAYCPSVLTENGFMSNSTDLSSIITASSKQTPRAKAIANGIVEYFKEIQ